MSLEQIALINENGIKQNNYPGRGIVIGMSPDAKKYIQVYWIMGRSENSRNRVFTQEGSFVKTEAFEKEKMTDPSLIIYYPAKSLEGYHIVTNGDQTDTIYDFLKAGKTFEDALTTREFEPDAPNYTPRISGLIDLNNDKSAYTLAILKAFNGDKDLCQRNYYHFNNFVPGFGHCIHTYKADGSPIPSFEGEPYVVKLHNTIEENAEYFWKLLNEDNKISLLVKFIDVDTKKAEFKIINKNVK